MSGVITRPRPDHTHGIRILSLPSALLAGFLCLGLCRAWAGQPAASQPSEKNSKAASDRCSLKVKNLEAFADAPEPRKRQTTAFTEDEINSYLALELKSKFHPSLRSLQFTFEEGRLMATAAIDFDKLSMSSSRLLGKLLARLFSGVHSLIIAGKLNAKAGMANFELEEARFDSSVLPNFLVEEIITAVGLRQKPPFDPLKPSKMPYAIDRVDVHHGHIVVFQ